MKKILAFIVLSLALVSCYDDYIHDFDYSSIYFAYQVDVRSFIVGEGMKVEVGAVLGGIMKNEVDRNVTFSLKSSLITTEILDRMKTSAPYIKDNVAGIDELEILPPSYYSMTSNNTMIIEAGQHDSGITIRPDSLTFLSDPLTIKSKYVLPFYIESAAADSIVESKRYSVVGLRYDNMLFGKYWHGGSALVNRPGKSDTTLIYPTTIPVPEAKIWTLTTGSPNSLFANGFLDQTSNKNEMLLTLDGNNLTISSVAGSTYEILPEGSSSFNRARLLQNRKLFLKYSYVNTSNGYTYHCTDTLTFRNRIRDGVNEWQDENPSHY